jgi:peptidoglycan hydrolase-like protein with peptidoglycan-binding domain
LVRQTGQLFVELHQKGGTMTDRELSRGDKGELVRQLQGFLNRVGAMLVPDGDFGRGTEVGVRYTQRVASQPVTGTADELLWLWLEQQPEPFPPLATNGVALIAREETGGLGYYEQITRWPHFPGVESGITIGTGYDLRFNTKADFDRVWSPLLPADVMKELVKDIGKSGTKTRANELKRAGIEIPFHAAWRVFIGDTLPRFFGCTEAIYPSLSNLPDLCRSALVSIVFNRGNSLSGPKRREMRNIRDILAAADDPSLHKAKRKMILSDVEDEIVSMKRLWDPSSGLIKRRQAEANLWREGLDAW